jgi:hypothetical protein
MEESHHQCCEFFFLHLESRNQAQKDSGSWIRTRIKELEVFLTQKIVGSGS